MTFSATNLLGIVKHVASVEAGCLGGCFGRPFEQTFPLFLPDTEPNADFVATDNSAQILELYRRVWRHSDETIAARDFYDIGEVSWWSQERRKVTLEQISDLLRPCEIERRIVSPGVLMI